MPFTFLITNNRKENEDILVSLQIKYLNGSEDIICGDIALYTSHLST
jgi:hypothetical protein